MSRHEWESNEPWRDRIPRDWEPNNEQCMHEGCPECHGTGRKRNGEVCVHYLVCRCRKCMILMRA